MTPRSLFFLHTLTVWTFKGLQTGKRTPRCFQRTTWDKVGPQGTNMAADKARRGQAPVPRFLARDQGFRQPQSSLSFSTMINSPPHHA